MKALAVTRLDYIAVFLMIAMAAGLSVLAWLD